MAISVDGGANPTAVYYNENDLNKVVYNGDIVWEKAAPKTIQSVVGTMEYEIISNTYTTVYANISSLVIYFTDGTSYADEIIDGVSDSSGTLMCPAIAEATGANVYFTFTSIDSDIYLEEPDCGGVTVECAQSVVNNNEVLGTAVLHIGSFTLSADILSNGAKRAWWGEHTIIASLGDDVSVEVRSVGGPSFYIWINDAANLVYNTDIDENYIYTAEEGPNPGDVMIMTFTVNVASRYFSGNHSILLFLVDADTDETIEVCEIVVDV